MDAALIKTPILDSRGLEVLALQNMSAGGLKEVEVVKYEVWALRKTFGGLKQRSGVSGRLLESYNISPGGLGRILARDPGLR